MLVIQADLCDTKFIMKRNLFLLTKPMGIVQYTCKHQIPSNKTPTQGDSHSKPHP